MDTVDIDVENLFNDGQLDQILPQEHALQPSTLAVPGLAEKFLNLQFCGGYNRVSWSRQGHIAIISEEDDGSTVSVSCLRSAVKNKEWRLSHPRPLDPTFENAVNVTWSPSAYDLAVTDSRGRISIFSMTTTCQNRLNESRSGMIDEPEDLGMPIGTWWLSQDRHDRPRNVISNAERKADKWVHNMTKAKALGPLYPRAFCMVNRKGVFNFLYQRPGARYSRTAVNLPYLTDTVYSHAAFSPTTEGKILVAVHSVSGDISVYHIQIDWPQDLMTDPTSTTQPDLRVDVIDNCLSMWVDADEVNNTLAQGYRPDDWVLTHLTIVPTSDAENAAREPPSIWAVYTSKTTATGADNDGFLLNSVIRRWNVLPHVRSLHPMFDNIPTKTEPSTGHEDVFIVARLTDLVVHQPIVSIELVDGGQMVAISTADGRTEFWNPVTQALVSYEHQQNEITSLAQYGFAFPPSHNAVATILSPNACSSLTLAEDVKPSFQCVRYPLQPTTQDVDLSDPHQADSVAALILAFARSCWSNLNGDDVLACVLSNYSPPQYTAFMSEMYRTLFRDTQFVHEKVQSSEADHLVSRPIVVKVLSFQMGLLSSNTFSVSSPDENIRFAYIAGTWSWVTMNIRHVATLCYVFYREYSQYIQAQQNPNQPQPHPISSAFADTICHNIHWVLDLIRFMVSTIIEIGDRQTNPDFFSPPTFGNNLGDDRGDGSQGLVALLLNCQWSRSFLCTIARVLRAFMESNEKNHNPIMARIVHTISRYSNGKGMNISTVDKLLDPKWYLRVGLQDGEQMDNAKIAQRQMAMYSTGRVGPEYANTLRNILETVINKPETGLRATGEIERLKLWTDTIDLNWLFLGFSSQFYAEPHSISTVPYAVSNNSSDCMRTGKLYDIHHKSAIIQSSGPDQPIRRCVRCGSVSGNVEGVDKSWSKSMIATLTRCVCDAYWILETIGGEPERE